jgi:GTP-binding protein
MLVDSATIFVRSGKGGDGHVSFRRAKYIPKGGPSGGDGGDGGSVILVSDPNVETLLDFAGRHHWAAENGEDGRAKQQHGANGADLLIHLPPGTLVYNDDTGELLADLNEPAKQVVLAKGGRGGFGNEHFKSPQHQAPREFTPGEPGVEMNLRLELKLIADVGLLGKPNAGKSTLLSRISKATPKIADYPFTTLVPQLGIAELSGQRRLVIADIPGLIENAHQGHGLGVRFLRHIERTRLLVHLLESEPTDGSDPVENYRVIRQELASYSPVLLEKPEIVVLSKMDLLGSEEDRAVAVRMVQDALGVPVMPISAVAGQGLTALLEACWARLGESVSGELGHWQASDASEAQPS